eukprot:2748409-Pleurochrysis_carterae.AAC.1
MQQQYLMRKRAEAQARRCVCLSARATAHTTNRLSCDRPQFARANSRARRLQLARARLRRRRASTRARRSPRRT